MRRSHSIEFKRQVAQACIAGEKLHGLAKRHDVARNLIRIWICKYEAGTFEDDAQALPHSSLGYQTPATFAPSSPR